MTPRKRKLWSRTIEESGISVRLYEREPGGVIYRDVWNGDTRDRKSLGHADRKLAEQQARELARRVADLRFAGHRGAVTFGQLVGLYRLHRFPQLSAVRQQAVKGYFGLLERHFPVDRVVDELGQPDVDSYAQARRSGALVSPRHRTGETGVHEGTIRNELHLLTSVIAWGQTHRVGGKRLITVDPLHGVTLPREKNAKRPIATEERYRKLLEKAELAEPTGRFRLVLTLARETGRRINSICKLSVRDILLSRDQMATALGAARLPLAWADQWPHGAILWRAANDKKGYESVAPLSAAARAALDAYLARYPMAGDVPLIPGRGKPEQAANKEIAGYWLTKAERLAKLPKLARGGFHPFRRLWASERRHLPAQDVAAAGGWRSLAVMRHAYQHADAAGMMSVVDSARIAPEPESDRHTIGTARKQDAS
jgi:integrase